MYFLLRVFIVLSLYSAGLLAAKKEIPIDGVFSSVSDLHAGIKDIKRNGYDDLDFFKLEISNIIFKELKIKFSGVYNRRTNRTACRIESKIYFQCGSEKNFDDPQYTIFISAKVWDKFKNYVEEKSKDNQAAQTQESDETNQIPETKQISGNPQMTSLDEPIRKLHQV